MSGIGYQMFGFAASIVSVVVLVPIVYAWVKERSPSAKMRTLEALLYETEALLRSALEEGTIDYTCYDRNFRNRIWTAKLRADDCRAEVYNITSRWHEFRLWADGLSSNISAVMDSLIELRGLIATTSARGRQQLTKLGYTANPTLIAFARRDHIPNVTQLAAPASTATLLRTAGWEGTKLSSIAECTAKAAPIGHVQHASIPAAFHATNVAYASAKAQSDAGLGNEKADALPPLAFPPQLKTARNTRRATKVILLPRLSKKPGVDGTFVKPRERQGFPGPFRIFSGFFQRSHTTTVPGTASSPTIVPPPPYTVSEAEIQLPTASWEKNNRVFTQVKQLV